VRGFGDSDKDKRETGEREETDGQRGIEIVERQGQTDSQRKREKDCLTNPVRINSNPGSAHNCPGVATPLIQFRYNKPGGAGAISASGG